MKTKRGGVRRTPKRMLTDALIGITTRIKRRLGFTLSGSAINTGSEMLVIT